MRVLGKGNKARIVPVGRKAREALAAWLKERGGLAKPDETALVRRHATARRLGPRGVQLRVAHWARSQGLAAARAPAPFPALVRHASA